MATIVQIPRDERASKVGKGIAGLINAYGAEKDRQKRMQALADVLDQQGGGQSFGGNLARSGAVRTPEELLAFLQIAQAGGKKTSKGTKFDAWRKDSGEKGTYFTDIALDDGGVKSLEDIEQEANKSGWTLIPPAGTGSKDYAPTDKDKAIEDYLGSKQLPSTARNRTQAREFLDKRAKAIDVVELEFGKKFGQDFEIDTPVKKEMNRLAQSQIEGFILAGMSAEQAGAAAAAKAIEVYEKDLSKVGGGPSPLSNELTPEEQERLRKLANEQGGLFKKIADMISGGDEEQGGQAVKSAQEEQGDMESYGAIQGTEILAPADLKDQALVDYIMREYNLDRNTTIDLLLRSQGEGL